MSGILTFIWAVIIFSLIIFSHELGHFITAKMFGVLVHEFAIGMGPAIFKKQKGETLYAVRAIPIGGYCKMEGEEGENENPRAFSNKKKYQRLIILAAGAFMNLLLGLILVIALTAATCGGRIPSLTIESVLENSPAYEAGIQAGDKIVWVDGKGVSSVDEYSFYKKDGDTAELKIKRDGKVIPLSVTPRLYKINPETGEVSGEASEGDENVRKMMGITFKSLSASPFNIFSYSVKRVKYFSVIILSSLGQLVTGKLAPNNLSGPVGIVNEIGTAAKSGILDIIFLAALITINLGLFNLLPFPALDGGRILFILIEAVIGKPLAPKYEGYFHFVGFVLLILLMIYATGNDIMRIFGG